MWQVALVEFQYPRTWKNITRPWSEFSVKLNRSTGLEDGNILHTHNLYDGFYSDNQTFINDLNKKIFQQHRDAGISPNVFRYNETHQHVRIVPGAQFEIVLSEKLATVLGFDGQQHIQDDKLGAYPMDVHHGVYSFYVYCNAVQGQLVGDASVPLLRITPIKPNHQDVVITKIFDSPHYVPVSKNYMESIEVNIKDDTGEDVPFVHGKTIVKLHFRPLRPAYL